MTDMNAAALSRGKVAVLDATLREGEQAPGVCFDPHVKMAIARLLDAIGLDVIEAGHPVVGGEVRQGLEMLAKGGFAALIGAHARALRHDVEAGVDSGAGFLGIFLCLSPERLRDRGMTLPAALECAAESIALAKERQPGLIVRFTPEDAVRSPLADIVEAARVAVGAGADIISVADTTGSMVPGGDRSLYDWVSRFRERLAGQGAIPRIAVHCHNDRGLALANALDGMRAGASIIDASVLGLGERAGIVDLASLLAVLSQDFPGSGCWRLEKMVDLYRLVSRYSGVPVPAHFPVMGRDAFRHCAGVHSQAMLQSARHYQSLDPAPFRRKAEIVLDHMSGRSAVLHALAEISAGGIDRDLVSLVLERVKAVGRKGRVVTLEELAWIVEFEERLGAKAATAADARRLTGRSLAAPPGNIV